MAGDWIPIQTDLSRRREILSISRATGRSRFEVVGLLVEFWGWASGETDVDAIVDVYVDTLPSLIGGDTEFWSAVMRAGWLESSETGFFIPNFDRWMSAGAKSRLRKNLRQKKWRDEQSNSGENVDASVDASVDAYVDRQTSTTEQNRTEYKKKTGTAGVLSLISLEILADPKRVLKWFDQASTGKRKILAPTETNKRLVIHLAQRVIRDPKIEDQVKVFVACVRDKNLKMTNAEEDAAIEMIKILERGPPGERTADLSNKKKTAEDEIKKLNAHFGKNKQEKQSHEKTD